MKKLLALALVLVLTQFSASAANKEGKIYVDDEYKTNYSKIEHNSLFYVPYRAILESIGATVQWNGQDETTDVTYKGVSYQSKFDYEPFREDEGKYLYFQDKTNDAYLYLNVWGPEGLWKIINDKIYLSEDTAKHLLEDLCCTCNIDEENLYIETDKNKLHPFMNADDVWGYRDDNGVVVVEPKYYLAHRFSENVAVAYLKSTGLCEYIDENGKVMFDKHFSIGRDFHDGYSAVSLIYSLDEKKRWSYIDKTGKFATDKEFDDACDFENGFAEVVLNGQKGKIDTNFNFYPDNGE